MPDERFGRLREPRAAAAALALPGVRGFVIGRALRYPTDGDVAAAVGAAGALAHTAAAVTP